MEKSLSHITAIVITYNEEDNIRRTLEALVLLSEVIVLDSGSTDRTREVADEFSNVRFIIRPFDNLMNQWNFGHTLTKKDWIISLDADYRLSGSFLQEIASLDLSCEAYAAPFKYCINGVSLRGTLLPPRIVFYNKQHAWYTQDGHAQHLNVKGKVGQIKSPIFHDDRKSLERWLTSQQIYSNQEILKLSNPQMHWKGADRLRMRTILAPFFIFFYALILKGGIWGGRKGMYYAFQRLYAELLFLLKRMERKILESDKTPKKS